MKLRCISPYENRSIIYMPGQEFEADEKLYRLLMADSPLSFEEVLPVDPVKIDTPEGTKVVRKRK